MRKLIPLLAIAVFVISSAAFGDDSHHQPAAKPELRPLQKIMQARAAWLQAMNENLAAKKFTAVVQDAEALSAQAKKVGDAAPNPLAKELHLAVANLAKATAEAAKANDEVAVKAKLGDIKATCAECHAKIRDKK